MPDVTALVRSAAIEHTGALFERPNVIGVGVALRQRRGEPTDEYVVVAYVSRKLPAEALSSLARVPRELETDGEAVGTDVVEVPEPQLLEVDTRQYRPLVGGCQIGTPSGAGTLGGIFYDRLDHRPVLLTNNHVLTLARDPTMLQPNTRVTQAAGGPQIGTAKRIVPLTLAPLGEFGYKYRADVDAGIVAPGPGVAVDFSVLELGPHPFVVQAPFLGQTVHHRGFRTQLREGVVSAVDVTITMKHPVSGDRWRVGGPGIGFAIHAAANKIGAWPGDSGSLVVDPAGGAALGLVCAGDGAVGGFTYACDLGAVMNRLNLESACTGGLNALIRRAVFRRYITAWSATTRSGGNEGDPALVEEMVTKVAGFRDAYLSDHADGRLSGAVGSLLKTMAVDLTAAVYQDEDAAGLLDRAFGDWLVLPTQFDMLEYQFPDTFAEDALRGWERVKAVRPDMEDPGWLQDALRAASGRSVRDLLGIEKTPGPTSAP